MTFTEFLELRSLLRVDTHEPGFLSLKLDPRILMHPAASALSSLSQGNPASGLLSAHLNIFTRTLELAYDEELIAPEILDTFLQGSETADEAQARTVASLFGIELQ